MELSQKMFEQLKMQSGMSVTLDNSDGCLVWYENRIQYRQSEDDKPVLAELVPMRRYDVQALITEIERLRNETERQEELTATLRTDVMAARAENAALRWANLTYRQAFDDARNAAAIDDSHLGRLIVSLADNVTEALDTKPNAAPVEPAPAREIKVGDTVRIVMKYDGGKTGRVEAISNLAPPMYTVWLDGDIDPSENGISYYRNEIEPA